MKAERWAAMQAESIFRQDEQDLENWLTAGLLSSPDCPLSVARFSFFIAFCSAPLPLSSPSESIRVHLGFLFFYPLFAKEGVAAGRGSSSQTLHPRPYPLFLVGFQPTPR